MAILRQDKDQVFDLKGRLVSETVVERDVTAEAVLFQVHQKLRAALGVNAAYLAVASPTVAQNTAQLKTLSRQVNALIRLIAPDLLVENTDT